VKTFGRRTGKKIKKSKGKPPENLEKGVETGGTGRRRGKEKEIRKE